MANVASQNTMVDDAVGRVLKALDESGLADSTLVIFSSDQGNFYGQHGLWQHTVVTSPSNLYEAALNIPLIMRQPGRVQAGGIDEHLIGQYDIPATILDYLGIEVSFENSPGRSFAGQLAGQAAPWEEVVFYEQEESRGIRTPEFAYWKRLPGTGSAELYDMKRDPEQNVNIIDDPVYRETSLALDQRLSAFFDSFSDPKYDLWNGGTAKGSVIRVEMFKKLYGPQWSPRTDLLAPFTE
jgi:arylsulfatase A-like enzyme